MTYRKVNAGVSSTSCSVAQNKDTVPPNQEANHLRNEEIIALDDEDAEAEGEEVGGTTGKRKKRFTSVVWQYFTKKTVVVEVDGKKYEQLWGYCNFPKCSARYRAESVNGTNAFRSHLRSTHSIVKDDDWKIQKRIVALFHLEGRHTSHRLAQAFTEVLVKWFVEKKMFVLTLDNASNNLVAVTDIIEDFKLNGNGSLVCDGIFFHIRCACQILNLVAKDGMAVISKQLEKIKALVLALKGSPLQWEELMKCAAQCGLDTSKGIQLDVSTRWNSTYMMLRDALYYKPAFIRLKIANRRKYGKISPSDTDWGMAATVFQCLEIFYDLTALLSGTSYPTANLFYRGFCEIRELLSVWKNHKNLTIKQMATAMSEKFEKYWSCSSTSLVVACFFDPRYKKKDIEFYMMKFAGAYYQVQLEEFIALVRKLYQFYSASKPASSSPSVVVDAPGETFGARRNSELESFLYDDCGPNGNELNELDIYMAEPLLKQDSFDILAYWKNQTDKYPILSQIARDLMSIQVSTVASESAVSGAGRVLDPYRNRLDPEMVEALVCTKDWIHARTKGTIFLNCLAKLS
ncbi:Unknown protein [Striga hermonthica]|uniref:Transposase n=1 Tax=Striga hermonthica TaxID=68872 RepID=A0A9N7NR80_STRHE|nr:Unknown protein [Striga hermonthica]